MLKTFAVILGIIGVPSVWSICVVLGKAIKKISKDVAILQSAQKAQMRSQLLHQYYFYENIVANGEKIASDDIDDWINQYEAYHELVGKNGVLDTRKEALLKFPTYQRK